MGECRPMSARITERQCGINQQRELFSCGKCAGLIRITEIDIEEDLVGKKGTCVKCKRPDMSIVSAGLCGKCYADNKKAAKDIEAQHETSPVGNEDITCADLVNMPVEEATAPDRSPRSLLSLITPPPAVKTEGFYLDFSNHPDLLVDLKAISDDVSGDILELCSMLVQGKLRGVA